MVEPSGRRRGSELFRIRVATPEDAEAVFSLASDLATSFELEKGPFLESFHRILSDEHASLLVATEGEAAVGYCLGFEHTTFFANGTVAWVEEITVSSSHRKKGCGRSMMAAFERWSGSRGAKLVAVATRRAAEFYRAVGYEESATYFRKLI